MTQDAETIYRQFGRLIEAMPEFKESGSLSPDQHKWLGLAGALVNQAGDISDRVGWNIGVSKLQTASRMWGLEELRVILYRLMAMAELAAPPSAQGAFIPVGDAFDAFASLAKILGTATNDVLIVDPYMDETVLTEFSGSLSEQVSLRLMSDLASYKVTLNPAAIKWGQQYGATRPLQVRLSQPKTLHDRAIFIDHKIAWTLTQSLKDFAKRSPAEIVRADDTAGLKIAAYEELWTFAQVVV